MPWHIEKTESCPSSKPWGVIKDADSKVVGCHETKDSAIKQLVVLEQIEKGSRPYLERLWQEEMHAVLLAAETSFNLINVKLNSSDKQYKLMFADTAERRKVGLSYRSQMPDGVDGMLFAYTEEQVRSFTAERTMMDLNLFGFNSEGMLQSEVTLPAGHIGPFVLVNTQFAIETNKDIEIEFLEIL